MTEEVDHLDQELARRNGHYQTLMDRHQELDDRIDELEQGRGHVEDLELKRLKRERLYLKQQLDFLRRNSQARAE